MSGKVRAIRPRKIFLRRLCSCSAHGLRAAVRAAAGRTASSSPFSISTTFVRCRGLRPGPWARASGPWPRGPCPGPRARLPLKAHRTELDSEDALWAHAYRSDERGDRRLLQFLLSRQDLAQLLSKVGKVGRAVEAARRASLTRIQLLEEAGRNCRCTCTQCGRWKAAAEEVVRLNGYTEQQVEVAILDALRRGRYKQRNVFIVGDTNRAKSFCLAPLAILYQAYTAPDSGTHQVADLKGAEILWLNDFEYLGLQMIGRIAVN